MILLKRLKKYRGRKSVIHIDLTPSEKCWNLEAWAFGSCYFCGCCDKDKKKRYESRLAWLERMLEENDNFQLWDDDPDGRVLQETNVRINHGYFMRKIRYYKRKLREMEKSNEN